jgi:1,4-alpha-glucan branching enzyme
MELLNSDDARWGGTGTGQPEGVDAEPLDEPRDGLTHALSLTLPPLAVLWLVREQP